MDIKSLDNYTKEQASPKPFKPSEKSVAVETYVSRRVTEMQDYRKELKVEDRWREADKEYVPGEIEFSKRKRFEQDQESGLSKLVPVGDKEDAWRSQNSEPTLLTKIQTAISIIIDQNPEAALTPMGRKYEEKTAIAYALWKRNWNVSNAKEIYKKFVFNLAKYGWAAGRSYPRLIRYEKDVLVEVGETPEDNKYEKKELTWFNDIAKESLNPYRTWIDEQTKPYEDYTLNECYFEKDYSYDSALVEFGQYENFEKLVPYPMDLRMSYDESGEEAKDDEKKKRKDIITIGFFESRLRDLYCIRIPKLKQCLYYSPLPNDDGLLSLFQTMWVMRDAEHPYGISLWEMIKEKKSLYDKMQNMTMDQLVLSIYKMFFYSSNLLNSDGKMVIKPGQGTQTPPNSGKMVEWLEIPGPGKDAFEGLKYLRSGMDDDSGVTPTLSGDLSDKNTLGEVLHAKEGALKRLKIPVENIADAIEQDAYITLSWMAQAYSTPEVKEFADLKEIEAYEMEMGVKRMDNGIQPLGGFDSMGAPVGPYQTAFLPEMSLNLDTKGGKLVESKSERFFAIGSDIKVEDIYWKGTFKVTPKSILASSTELEKRRKMEIFNLIAPLLPQPPQIYAKALKQVLKVNEEDPNDWLPDTTIQFLDQGNQSLFIQAPMPMQQPGQGGTMQGGTMQGTAPNQGAPTVVPQDQAPLPPSPGVSQPLKNEALNAV